MAQFNIHEAKTNLSRLVDMVQRGEEVVLSRHGKPLSAPAKLSPAVRRIIEDGEVAVTAARDQNLRDYYQPYVHMVW